MLANNKRAMTLPELLIGSMVAVFVLGTGFATYYVMNNVWKQDIMLSELTREGAVGVHRMTSGVHGNEGILAARNIVYPTEDDPTSNYVQFEDSTGIDRSFTYSNGVIQSESGQTILSNVKSCVFTKVGKMIRINLTVNGFVLGKEIEIPLETSVKPRN